MMGEFMMNTDTYTADNWLNHTMPDAANNYVRLQVATSLAMDKIDTVSINNLIKTGDELWTNPENNAKLSKILRSIVD